MSAAQLDLFIEFNETEDKYHWAGVFPEWMPVVGGYCSLHTPIYSRREGAPAHPNEAEERYHYMVELKVLRIDGDAIDCLGVTRKYYSGCEEHVGKMFFLTMDDIWLATYIQDDAVAYAGRTFRSDMGREFTVVDVISENVGKFVEGDYERDITRVGFEQSGYTVELSILDTWEDITVDRKPYIHESITPELIAIYEAEEAKRKALLTPKKKKK